MFYFVSARCVDNLLRDDREWFGETTCKQWLCKTLSILFGNFTCKHIYLLPPHAFPLAPFWECLVQHYLVRVTVRSEDLCRLLLKMMIKLRLFITSRTNWISYFNIKSKISFRKVNLNENVNIHRKKTENWKPKFFKIEDFLG